MCKRLCHGLLILLLVTGCAPRQGLPTDEAAEKPRMMTAGQAVSAITISHVPERAEAGDGKGPLLVHALRQGGERVMTSSLSDDVYAHLEAAVQRDARRFLVEDGRWSEGDGVEIHLEIIHLRLRNTASQLFLPAFVAGSDDIMVQVTLSRDGEAFVSGSVSTKLETGGIYGTLTLNKRLDFLAQQLARKIVRTRL